MTTTGVRLGPAARRASRILGGLIGVPIGLGIVMPPHGLLIGLGCAASVTWIVGGAVIALMRGRRFTSDNSVAIGAMGRGELAKARELFAYWARTSNPVFAHHESCSCRRATPSVGLRHGIIGATR